jgi:tight adherence protein B
LRWLAVALSAFASMYFLTRRARGRSRAAAKRALEMHLSSAAPDGGAFSLVKKYTAFLATASGAFLGRSRDRLASAQCDVMVAGLTAYMQCGIPFQEAMALCARDIPPPLSEHLKGFLSRVELGGDVPRALEELVLTLGNRDFELVSLAASTSRETGSDIRSVMGAVGEAARERAAIRRELETQTVQGKMSGRIVAGLPVIFLALSCVLSRGTLWALLGTLPGIVMLTAAVVLNTLGFLWIRKILDLKTW